MLFLTSWQILSFGKSKFGFLTVWKKTDYKISPVREFQNFRLDLEKKIQWKLWEFFKSKYVIMQSYPYFLSYGKLWEFPDEINKKTRILCLWWRCLLYILNFSQLMRNKHMIVTYIYEVYRIIIYNILKMKFFGILCLVSAAAAANACKDKCSQDLKKCKSGCAGRNCF